MLDSINIGISGMNAYSDALKTISNNVANMNTPGFAASTSSFSDLVYSNDSSQGALRSGNYQQFGNGVSYDTTLLNFSSGGMKTTTGPLDLAINGQGFFALTNAQGQMVYVRTGQFQLKDGFIVKTGSDSKLQIKADNGTLAAASTVGKEISKAVPTTKATFTGTVSVDSGATDMTTPGINVVDQLGNTHVLSMVVSGATTQDSTGTKNQKVVTVTDAKGTVLGTGTISYSLAGAVDTTTSSVQVTLTAVGGATTSVSFDFASTTAGTTATPLAAPTVDGYAQGSISAVIGTAAGKLEIDYTNGQKVTLGDIAVANFDNLQELKQLGGAQFQYTGKSPPIYGTSGKEGLGTVTPDSLENSNVNLSDEFGNLILVQRGYQASSQIISTANEMLGHVFELRSQR